MTVAWLPGAQNDRATLLRNAVVLAKQKADPQIYVAAVEQDRQIRDEGHALDGIATYLILPDRPGTHVYPCKGGRVVILYARNGDAVEILRVLPLRSHWKASTDLTK